MTDFFPEIEPYKTHRLKVSSIHELYIEEVGNPEGQPVVFLHGGPGAGLSTKYRRFFDPKHYRVILFDQRGSGQSTPHASLEENTTWHLVDDIEKIRNFFGIGRWMVFGGSWGSTLGLSYAETHPEVVTGLILRGIFLCRPEEIEWFYQKGCDLIFPDLWEDFIAVIPPEERHDMIRAYYRRLTSSNANVALTAAKAWSEWEGRTVKLLPDPETLAEFQQEHMAVSLARIECHYFVNNCFFTEEDQLIRNAHKLRNIPIAIVHGRYDVVCPVKNAWDLHKVLPNAEFRIIPDSGHSADEPGILTALIGATEKFKGLK